MRIDDLRIAFVGIVLIAVGVVSSIWDFFYLAPNRNWWLVGLVFETGVIVAGVGFLYVAFSKKYRTEP